MSCSSDAALPYVISPKKKQSADLIWNSSDNQILKVIDGTLVALKTGTAKVTLTYKGVSDACQVFICDYPLDQPFYELADQNWYYTVGDAGEKDDAVFYLNHTLYYYDSTQAYREENMTILNHIVAMKYGDDIYKEGETWQDLYEEENKENYIGSTVLVKSTEGEFAILLHDKSGTYIVGEEDGQTSENMMADNTGDPETFSEIETEVTEEKKEDTTTGKKPETTTAKKPETTTAKKPETTTAKKPETTTAKKPETTTAKQPETTTAKQPETTTAKKPETTTAKEPETTTEAVNKKPTSYKISLSKSTISLYERFTVVVTPNVTDYTKIVIHAIDPTGSRWDFTMSGTNSKTLYVDDASLTGTWKIYATVTNPYGSYTGDSVSLHVR